MLSGGSACSPLPEPASRSGVRLLYWVLIPYSKWYVVSMPSGFSEPLRSALVLVRLVGGSTCVPRTASVWKTRSRVLFTPLAFAATIL
jgi:hypothetical protein